MFIGIIFQILLLDQVLKENIEEGSTSVSMKSFISKHPQIELLLTFLLCMTEGHCCGNLCLVLIKE